MCCADIDTESRKKLEETTEEVENALLATDTKVHTTIAHYTQGAESVHPTGTHVAVVPGLKPKIDAIVPSMLTEEHSPIGVQSMEKDMAGLFRGPRYQDTEILPRCCTQCTGGVQ